MPHISVSLYMLLISALWVAVAKRSTEDSEAEVTRLRFKMPSLLGHSFAEVGATTSTKSRPTASHLAQAWEDEIAFYNNQAAVKQIWKLTTEVWDYSSSPEALTVERVKSAKVPGLDGVTFGEVFTELLEAGCPIWMIGGTVRDIVAQKQPNDIDCAALCNSNTVRQVATTNEWKHDQAEEQYFAIGDVHGDDPNYLEGFSIDLILSDPFDAETTVNMLMWSLSKDYIIDPTGKGVDDASNHWLRPGAPDKEYLQDANDWGVMREWALSGFSSPTLRRHVRYVKMRMRGWKPATKCFRFFMADQIHEMSYIEAKEPSSRLESDSNGQAWVPAPAATLVFLAEKFDQAPSPQARGALVESLFKVYEEDLGMYFAATANPCDTGGKLAKDRHKGDRSPLDVFGKLRSMCAKPSKYLAKLVGQTDISGVCKMVDTSYRKKMNEKVKKQRVATRPGGQLVSQVISRTRKVQFKAPGPNPKPIQPRKK